MPWSDRHRAGSRRALEAQATGARRRGRSFSSTKPTSQVRILSGALSLGALIAVPLEGLGTGAWAGLLDLRCARR
jgi:hypothetical protein